MKKTSRCFGLFVLAVSGALGTAIAAQAAGGTTARKSPQSSSSQSKEPVGEQWRYVWKDGHWWYWMPDRRWFYYSHDQWRAYHENMGSEPAGGAVGGVGPAAPMPRPADHSLSRAEGSSGGNGTGGNRSGAREVQQNGGGGVAPGSGLGPPVNFSAPSAGTTNGGARAAQAMPRQGSQIYGGVPTGSLRNYIPFSINGGASGIGAGPVVGTVPSSGRPTIEP